MKPVGPILRAAQEERAAAAKYFSLLLMIYKRSVWQFD